MQFCMSGWLRSCRPSRETVPSLWWLTVQHWFGTLNFVFVWHHRCLDNVWLNSSRCSCLIWSVSQSIVSNILFWPNRELSKQPLSNKSEADINDIAPSMMYWLNPSALIIFSVGSVGRLRRYRESLIYFKNFRFLVGDWWGCSWLIATAGCLRLQ